MRGIVKEKSGKIPTRPPCTTGPVTFLSFTVGKQQRQRKGLMVEASLPTCELNSFNVND